MDPRNRAVRLLADRPQAHAAHAVSHTVMADRDPISGLVVHHPPAAAAGTLQVEGVNPDHAPQGRFADRYRLL
jgi:hypothetical protein